MRIHHASTWLLAALFSASPIAPIAARADDAASLLAKHRAFVGWQYGDGSVRSLLLEQTYTDSGGKITQHATERRVGLAYRCDYPATKDYAGDASRGFTGNLFWTTSENGFTVPVIGDIAKYYLAYNVLFNEGTSELPATLKGTTTVDGKTVDILHITMNGALPYDVYEDPDTGAFVRAVLDPGGQYDFTIKIKSYTDIGQGKKYVGTWSFNDNKGQYAYTKITLNAAVSAGDLHPPASAATWVFANNQPSPIKVTDSRLYIDAKVNGVPGRFAIDTGASTIVLTDDFASRAHVKTVDKSTGIGVAGQAKMLVRKAETVEIGGNTLSNVIVDTVNQTFKDTQNNEQPDGLIGFDLFAGAIVDLNLGNHTIRILDPAVAADGRGGYPLTPDLTAGVPQVPASVDGKVEVKALLDTGGLDFVEISSDVENHGVNLIVNSDNTFLGGNAAVRGVGGGTEMVRCGPLAKIQVGPFTYSQVQACESHDLALHDALIGFDFLKHFDYVFDYPHGVVYLIPHKE